MVSWVQQQPTMHHRSGGWMKRHCLLWLALLISSSQAWSTVQKVKTDRWKTMDSDRRPYHGSNQQIPRSTPRRANSRTRLAADLSMTDSITTTTSTIAAAAASSFDPGNVNVVVITIVALALAVAAQGFINQMVQGDQGLGAFLRDGSGFQKSAFQPMRKKKEFTSDPLPWLKLPKLDFVEVAGQETVVSTTTTTLPEQDKLILETLQQLQEKMNVKLQEGKEVEARIIRNELERIMKENGIEYTTEN